DRLRGYNVDECRSVFQCTLKRLLKVRRVLDPLAIRPQRPRKPGIIGMTQGCADNASSVVHFLIEALDVPRRIVGYDEDDLCTMPDGGVDFHCIDAERTVAVDGNNLPRGQCKCRGDCKRNAYPETAKGARVHVNIRP